MLKLRSKNALVVKKTSMRLIQNTAKLVKRNIKCFIRQSYNEFYCQIINIRRSDNKEKL